jgi:phytoene dehydrogenase-like protein
MGHPLDGSPTALLHRDLVATAVGLGRDGPAWRRLVGRVAAGGSRLVDAVLSPLDVPPRAPVALAAFGAVGGWPSQALGRAAFREAPARALLSGLAAHAVLPLTSMGTAGIGLLLGGLAHAVGWPVAVGGSQSIADSLVARLQSLGGAVETGVRVHSMAELPPARDVVLDLTPRQVLEVAGDRLPDRYRRRLDRYRYGPGVFKVDWALDGPVPWRDPLLAGAGTVHLGGRAEAIADAEAAVARGRLPERPFVLFAQATVADPTRAPAGRHTGWAYCHVPNGCEVDRTEAVEAQVERFAPGFRDRVLARHVMGPAALEAHNANEVGGDIGGGASDVRQLLMRPVPSRDPWRTPVEGLYLCSASTPPGGGVHGMGGWHAARSLLRHADGDI